MGSLYWQINDCWPVASWSSIDYFGRWKALQYYSRRFYNDLLISPYAESDNLHFYVVSDRLTAVPAQVRMTLMNFEGEKLLSEERNVTIKPNSSSSYLDVPLSSLLKGRDATNLMVYCELSTGGQVLSRNEYFFSAPKKLALPRPSINVDVLKVRGGYKITLASDKFAQAVYLSLDKYEGFFVDNYFDILPGEKVEVTFYTRKAMPVDVFKKLLSVRTMVDALS
jgi:beta-mannosidase